MSGRKLSDLEASILGTMAAADAEIAAARQAYRDGFYTLAEYDARRQRAECAALDIFRAAAARIYSSRKVTR